MTARIAPRSAAALSPLSERDFQRQLTDLAGILGWQHVHFRPAETRHGWRTPVEGPLGEGWPDLILVHPAKRRLIFAELKRDGAKTTPAQDRVLELLRCLELHGEPYLHGPLVEVFTWWPADLEAIAEVLGA